MDEPVNYGAQYTAVNGEGDVSDGSVDYYDFDWGQPVEAQEDEMLNEEGKNEICCGCSSCMRTKKESPQQEKTEDYEIIEI